MKFRVYEPRRGHWWMLDPEDSTRFKCKAYVFDSDNEDEVENVKQDFVKAKCVIKVVL